MFRENQDDVTTVDKTNLQPILQYGESSILGTRSMQQDSLLTMTNSSFFAAVVCDGMGGLESGEVASRTATARFQKDFMKLTAGDEIAEFLHEEAAVLDEEVYELKTEAGEFLDAGTTIVSVIICQNQLHWMSAGDSKIYFIREGELSSLTREHNYRLSLDILKRRGMISAEDYISESEKGEALISYLGMGNLSLIDGNREAIDLERGDMILLCSDGLYKSMSEEEILEIMLKYKNLQKMAVALTDFVTAKGMASQDNTSVIVLRYA